MRLPMACVLEDGVGDAKSVGVAAGQQCGVHDGNKHVNVGAIVVEQKLFLKPEHVDLSCSARLHVSNDQRAPRVPHSDGNISMDATPSFGPCPIKSITR